MKIIYLFYTVILSLLIEVSTGQEYTSNNIEVSIYYSSNSPASRSFITEQLLPAYMKLGRYLKLDFLPFEVSNNIEKFLCNKDCHGINTRGKNELRTPFKRLKLTDYTRRSYISECSRRPKDCQGDIFQTCAFNQTEDDRVKLKFVFCSVTNSRSSNVNDFCANKAQLDKNLIEICRREHGQEILSKFSEGTRQDLPEIFTLPQVKIEGNFVTVGKIILSDDLCRTLKGVSECQSKQLHMNSDSAQEIFRMFRNMKHKSLGKSELSQENTKLEDEKLNIGSNIVQRPAYEAYERNYNNEQNNGTNDRILDREVEESNLKFNQEESNLYVYPDVNTESNVKEVENNMNKNPYTSVYNTTKNNVLKLREANSKGTAKSIQESSEEPREERNLSRDKKIDEIDNRDTYISSNPSFGVAIVGYKIDFNNSHENIELLDDYVSKANSTILYQSAKRPSREYGQEDPYLKKSEYKTDKTSEIKQQKFIFIKPNGFTSEINKNIDKQKNRRFWPTLGEVGKAIKKLFRKSKFVKLIAKKVEKVIDKLKGEDRNIGTHLRSKRWIDYYENIYYRN